MLGFLTKHPVQLSLGFLDSLGQYRWESALSPLSLLQIAIKTCGVQKSINTEGFTKGIENSSWWKRNKMEYTV